ncbi:MAG: glycosyltransferase 87 family protein [Clostridia bacterium]|nr:glycosyltransferase 87 family protein [Clostridia bacterium]
MQIYKERNKKIIIFFVVFLAFYGLYYLLHSPTFLFPAKDMYKDFATINYALKDNNPYISRLSNYPPIILAFAKIFALMNDWSIYNPMNLQTAFDDPAYMRSLIILFAVYGIFLLFSCVLYAWFENKRERTLSALDKAGNIIITMLLATAFFFSAPSRFMMDRGNYLVVTIVLMVLWAVFEEMKPDTSLGAIFAALAAATKVYPIYLLGMYITEKKWHKTLVAIFTGLVVTVIPICFFAGRYSTNCIVFVQGVLGFGGVGGGIYSVYYTVGVTGLAGVMFTMMGMLPHGNITKLIWLASGAFFTIVGFAFLVKEKKLWKKLLILTSLMVFLSPNSYLYNSCYLFAPILVMLMNKDKLMKRDIPYIVISALLLVPKSYFYFPSFPIGIPTEYSDVNIAVLLDCLLYLIMLLYYIVEKFICSINDLKAISEEKKSKVMLSDRTTKILKAITISSTVFIVISILYFLRGNLLACHDSIADFISARVSDSPFAQGFEACRTYGLARGRVGFIFPIIVGIRYLISSSGNYVLVWLMQYVPVCANIALLGYIIGKKINKYYGFAFALCFWGLLQIDVWHNLITCYPLDFMYGFFIMVCGLYLYSEYLNRKDSLTKGDKQYKLNILRLVGSFILFYESMQVYESFIVSSLIYAVITISYVMKVETKFTKRVIKFFVTLIPHITVAVIFLIILTYLRINPVVNVGVSSFVEDMDPGRFFVTYFTLSMGMFPLFDMRVVSGLREHINIRGVIMAVIALAGFVSVFYLACRHYTSLDKKKREDANRTLAVLAVSGVLLALTFAIPHSLIGVYVSWVVDYSTGGYVPTTICYFGWSMAIFSVVMLLAHYFSRLDKLKRLCAILMMGFVFAGATYVTVGINDKFDTLLSSTGSWMSTKAHCIWEVMSDDKLDELHPEVIYTPSMDGVHSDMRINDSLLDHEVGYDVQLCNDIDYFRTVFPEYDNKLVMIYDDDAKSCFLADADDYTIEYNEYVTTKPLYIATTEKGEVTIRYMAVLEDRMISYEETFKLDSNELTEITLKYPARVKSINIMR